MLLPISLALNMDFLFLKSIDFKIFLRKLKKVYKTPFLLK